MSHRNRQWLTLSAFGIVITGVVLMVITIWVYSLQMKLAAGHGDPQQLMNLIPTLFHHGIVVGWIGFVFYLVFWVQISKLLGEVIRQQMIGEDNK